MHFYALHLLGHQTVYGACSVPLAQQAADRYPAILLTTLDAAGDAAFEPYTGATLTYGWGALHHSDSATEAECLEWSRGKRRALPFTPTEAHLRALGWSDVTITYAAQALAVWPVGSVPDRYTLELACDYMRRGSSPRGAVDSAKAASEVPF